MTSLATIPRARAGERMRVALEARLTWAPALALVGGLLALVGATNRWMSFGAGFVYARANDEHAYLRIANAFPHLPEGQLPSQHAQRWPGHWLIGGIADLLGTQPELVYRWAAIALAVAILLVLAAVLMRIGASTGLALVCLAVFALNPYALRYYALAPGYLDDLVLELGVALVLLGLAVRRLPLVLGGLLLGVLGRQTMVPVALVAAPWVVLAPGWRTAPRPARAARALAALGLPVGAYLAIRAVAAGFSLREVPFSRLTILDAVSALPGTAHDLANHFAHVAIVLLPIGALLLAALLRSGLRGQPPLFWAALAIGLVIVAQAAALNPDPIFNDYGSSNEPRLTAMALAALAIALAAAQPHVSPRLALAALAGLLLASLHQDFTIVSTGSAGATFALQAGVALALGVAVWRGGAQPSRRLSAA